MDKQSQPTNTHTTWNTLKYLQFVVIVAAVLATLFTAWTEPGLLTDNLNQNYIIQAIPETTDQIQSIEGTISDTTQRVGIVAGHSGNDSGAVCPDGLTEVSINQQIAAYVQKFLTEEGLTVDILQEFDSRLMGYKALALVSIHADSCEYINNEATGFKVASALSNPRPERAARLISCFRSRYAQFTGLPLHNSITLDMTSYHAFDEIDSATSAVIIEVGFMNLDRQLLTQQTDLVARGIASSILCFINNEDISTPTPP
jgi:N-acetylmuramoyl-L-alanine amidase